MKKFLLVILLVLASACSDGDGVGPTASGIFTSKSPFPELVTIRGLVCFSIGSKGYLVIPNPVGDGGTGKFWEYDTESGSWTRKNDHPGITFQSPVFVTSNKAIVISGNTVREYDPISDHWTTKNNAPGADKRAGFAFAIGGYGYLGGGFYNGDNFWRYDIGSDTWSQLTDHPSLGDGTNDPSVSAIDGISFVVGSKAFVTGTNMFFWEYDPANDQWTQKASVDAVYGQTFTIGEKGYVLNAKGEVNQYDVTSDSWSITQTLPGRNMCYPAGFSINDRAYIGVGGLMEDNTCTLYVISDFWSYEIN